jgi:rod shape-determining protein MreC
MENLLSRYRNVCILVGVLFAQVLGLAVQVRRVKENESTMLIRVWTVTAITPLEKGIVGIEDGVSNLWHNYIYLHGVRQENRQLRQEIQQLRLDEVRLSGDAEQARRLQVLFGFKEKYLSKTVAVQVIGSGGSQHSRVIFIDKGEDANLQPDMPVITADGIVGKIVRVFGRSSQVLLINDESSGAGAILENSRLQGILKGTPLGGLVLDEVMPDEQVQAGDRVLTSGGDRIFPKGLPIGTVAQVFKGKSSFLDIRITPAADLNKLEEALVVTKQEEKVPSVADMGDERASDILARRLPMVPTQPATTTAHQASVSIANAATGSSSSASNAPKQAQTAAPKTHTNAVLPAAAQSGANPGNSATVVKTITDEDSTPRPLKAVEKSAAPATTNEQEKAPQAQSNSTSEPTTSVPPGDNQQ